MNPLNHLYHHQQPQSIATKPTSYKARMEAAAAQQAQKTVAEQVERKLEVRTPDQFHHVVKTTLG